MFSSDTVKQKLKDLDVLVVYADLTDNDAEIWNDLDRANRSSIPVNFLYPSDPKKPAILLPAVLTPSIMLEALDKVSQQ